ncbi:hypothetical protein GcM3_027045 [Golovinomyces cichoracearum]|uniref:Uncharacterized protein n=1 Tax=Golovinomyces cichoracearum TaxID=62708 RepID=A0A420J5X8_9PEZI|nr:hypothetical protein GcM3_027045 [Golovinomyces cichoracearum]
MFEVKGTRTQHLDCKQRKLMKSNNFTTHQTPYLICAII